MRNKGKNGSAGKEVLVVDDISNHHRSKNSSIAPPDGGYGWVIVFASFCSNVIVDGIIFTTGEALVGVWEQDFRTTAMQASIAQSLLTGSYLLAGPLASALANLLGCRLVAIIGALTTFAGFILSSFVPSLSMLYITFGIMGGIGFGLLYLPSVVIVNHYFEKRRALAMGIAVCGSGIGTTIFSQVFPFLLRYCNNNWRSFLVYVAFITLLSILCALCYREVPSVTSENDDVEKTALIILETKSNQREEVFQASNNVKKPVINNSSDSKHNTFPSPTANGNGYHKMSHSNIDLRSIITQNKKAKSDFDLPTMYRNATDWYHSLSPRSTIYYPGSVSSLQERISRRGSQRAKASLTMTSITTTQVIPQRIKERSTLRAILCSMVDTSLLSNPSFILLAVTGFLTLCSLFVPFIFLGKQAVKVGATPNQQSYLLLAIGIANILGRIICGLISDLPRVDPLLVHNMAIIGSGLATCTIPLLTEYWMYVVYTIPFAWGVACFSALRTIICVELLGLEKLSNAFGMMMLFMGIAALIGPPIAALLKDLSGNFDLSFYLMGALLTLSGVLCIPLRMVNLELSDPLPHDNTGELGLKPKRTGRF